MKGTVVAFNKKKGFAAIETDGGITVAELFSCEADIGDIITGDLENLGDETFNNETQAEEFDVYVIAVKCAKPESEELLA